MRSSTAAPLGSAPPTIVIEIAEPVKAALQLVGATALLLGYAFARLKPAPAEVGSGIAHPRRASKAAPKARVGVGLYDGDTGIDLARRALTFDITAPVVAAKLK